MRIFVMILGESMGSVNSNS